jgi:uncharacterized protein YqeY
MNLEQRITTDLKVAMLAKDEAALRSLRAIKAALILAKTAEGATGEISSDEEIKLLQKLVKQRKDSIDIFEKQNRHDLVKKEKDEVEIIEKYLPKQLTIEEVKEQVANIIKETGATSAADLGKVMGVATKKLSGRTDGKTISAAAKELLSQ